MANEEKIRELAYELWEQEGRPEGRDLDHYDAAKNILEDADGGAARPSNSGKTAVATAPRARASRATATKPRASRSSTTTSRKKSTE